MVGERACLRKSWTGLRDDKRIATQQELNRITGAGIANFKSENYIWQTLKNIQLKKS
jgi:hypothetical protein